jgi:hypothetical protein
MKRNKLGQPSEKKKIEELSFKDAYYIDWLYKVNELVSAFNSLEEKQNEDNVNIHKDIIYLYKKVNSLEERVGFIEQDSDQIHSDISHLLLSNSTVSFTVPDEKEEHIHDSFCECANEYETVKCSCGKIICLYCSNLKKEEPKEDRSIIKEWNEGWKGGREFMKKEIIKEMQEYYDIHGGRILRDLIERIKKI